MNKNKQTIGTRLKICMELFGLTQLDILKKVKIMKTDVTIFKSELSNYVNDRFKPRPKKLQVLAEVLHVNEAWLMGYDVPMTDDEIYHIKNLQAAKNYLKFFDSQIDSYFTGTYDYENLTDKEIIQIANEFQKIEHIINKIKPKRKK